MNGGSREGVQETDMVQMIYANFQVTAYVALGFMTYIQARGTVCAYVTRVLGKTCR